MKTFRQFLKESSIGIGLGYDSPNEAWNDIKIGSQFILRGNIVTTEEKTKEYIILKDKNNKKIKLTKDQAFNQLKR